MLSRRSLLGGLSSLPFLNWNLQAKTTEPTFPINHQALMGLYKKTAKYNKNLLTDSKVFQKLSQYEADTIDLSESNIQSLCNELNLKLSQNSKTFPLPVAFTGRVDLNSDLPIKVQTCYFKDGFLHRENGPAVIGINFNPNSGAIDNSILKFYENGEASDYNGVNDFIKKIHGYRYYIHYKNANTPVGSPYVITASSINTLCMSFRGEDATNLQHPHVIQINVDAEDWNPQHNDNFKIIYSKHLNYADSQEPNKLVPFLGKLTPAYEIRDRVVEFAENEFIRLEEMTKFFYENR